MNKKFTRAMVCEEFKSTCGKCPLHSGNNFKSLPCWLINESDIQDIMKDYPYADVKVRMIFNDIETRLTAVEEKVEKKVTDGVEFTFKPGRIISGDFSIGVVDQKLYDKLQAKHEADCRLISEYDLEIKKLKEQNAAQNDIVCDLYSNLHTEQRERIRCEAVIVDKNQQIDEWKKRYKELECMYEKKNDRLFDLENAENERDHYKGLYSSKCDDYDMLLEKQLKTEKDFTFYRDAYMKCNEANDKILEKQHNLREELIKLTEQKDHYKNLFHSLNHNYQNLVGELKSWKDKYKCINDDYIGLEKEYNEVLSIKNSLEFRNKDLINENNKLRKAYNDATDNIELEDKIEAQKTRITNLESKLRNQRANLTSLEQKLKETEEKLNDARALNKMREDVFNSNIKLQQIIEAKDREIGLLRVELDKYTPDDDDDECDID